ncbi:hypothetical protein D3C85_1343760 [compost metagenome]
MQEAGERQAELLMQMSQAGETGTGDGGAVISTIAADDLAPLWLSEGAPVVPGQLDCGVVGFGTRAGEQHFGHGHRRQRDQALCQLDGRLGRAMCKVLVVGQLLHLFQCGGFQTCFAVTQRGTPHAGHGIQILLALVIPRVDALATDHHGRTDLLMVRQMGLTVDVISDVAGVQWV